MIQAHPNHKGIGMTSQRTRDRLITRLQRQGIDERNVAGIATTNVVDRHGVGHAGRVDRRVEGHSTSSTNRVPATSSSPTSASRCALIIDNVSFDLISHSCFMLQQLLAPFTDSHFKHLSKGKLTLFCI